MEMGNVGSSTPDIQMGCIGSVSSGPGSQQFLMSNNQMGMMPNYTGSQDLSMTNMHMGHIANGNGNQFGEMSGLPTDLGSYQLGPMKRKAPVEPMFFNPGSHQLMSNKRMAQLEHRPWLQQAPAANKRTVQLESTTSAPGSQNLSAPSKKMVKMDSFSGRSGPISKSSKNQTSQMQPSPKAQNESFESVRSKMRKTLAASLALVNQQEDKSLESGNKSPGKSQEAPGPAEDPKGNLPSSETSTPKNNIPESAGQSIMSNVNTSGSTLSSICDGKEFRASNILPYDVSFGDNLFVKDELLQGNGLSWVLESDIEMIDGMEFLPAVKEELDHEMGIPPKEQEVSPPEVAFQTPEQLASEIEAELFKLFGGVNKKYKEKGRSLLFNLKDRNNPELRERVMSGEITPARLCSMTAEELASKELSEWRMAKAEELAQMVVLPDSELDMRRLVKKTHKGEVEVEQFDNASMDVPISLDQGQSRIKESEVSTPLKSVKRKIEVKARSKNNDVEESFTFPSNDGTYLLQGLMVDDGLKDLPPIVSLDEFMESLDNEPPFEIPPEDVTPVSDKEESGTGSESKSSASSTKNSMQVSPQKHDEVDATKPEDVVKSEDSPAANRTEDDPTVIKTKDGPAVIGTDDRSAVSKTVASVDLKSTDTGTEVKSINGLEKAESKPVQAHKGEHIWGGSLQLSISTKASVVGIFKSGEKTSAKDWPGSLEIKGRVRLDAFEKFLQELPQSRSRAVMVVHFVSKDGSSESDCSTLHEVRDSYTSDGRVGFAEPCSGVELYLCPPHNKTCDMLSKIIQKEHVEALNSIDNGLIGVIVWRKLSSPKSSSHQKHVSKKRHYSSSSSSSSRRQHDTNSAANYTFKPSEPRVVPPTNTKVTHDDEEDEVPPGFGPPASRDDDDLPEFNYSGSNSSVPQFSTQRPAVDKMRELILKYGQNKSRASWIDHDDDDDIPEWQPDAPPSQYQPAVNNCQQPIMRPHMASTLLQQQPMQPQMNVALGIQTPNSYWQQGNQWTPPPLPQSGGMWASNVALQPESGQFYEEPDRGTGAQLGLAWRQNAPRSRGF